MQIEVFNMQISSLEGEMQLHCASNPRVEKMNDNKKNFKW